MKSFLHRNGSCLTSFILIPAGYEKLSWGQGEHLPNKLKRKNGRASKACRPGKAPALHTLFLIRQGSESLPAKERSCPIHFLYKRHGKPKQQALSDSEQQALSDSGQQALSDSEQQALSDSEQQVLSDSEQQAQSGSKPQTRSGSQHDFSL